MRLLAIDFGQSKLGLALADSKLAQPLEVIHYSSIEEILPQIKDLVHKEGIEKVIVGFSEGESAAAAQDFGQQLEKQIAIPVEFSDETLSTQEAQQRAIQAGIKRSKRQKMEDAYAATIILENYLDKLKL